jgi:hypothetical protein
MLVSLLVMSLAQSAVSRPTPLGAPDDSAARIPAAVSAATPVVLDCQVAERSLTDCKAVNAVSDTGVVAEAIRMAAGIVVPQGLAESGIARIKVKMNVTP